ncbi:MULTISPECIES: replication-associated recombination protein A [Bacillus]|uniref:Putative ATPase (AAA family) associated with cysteine desulfurase n=1 Tax=Bacillus cereus TaxID=1396 RepID=A0A161T6E7_BACCE|nr:MULTISPECIES: replication-associated recombination protein A [Bacillus]KZD66767.1 putative ATPase (AAA family) associated with cysteine desulfurase [Bacillus cereus]TSI22013.1 replication-associated recombination protein A [Bacillus sp. HY001]
MLNSEPLSYQMRPTTIEQIVGQEEIIGSDTALYKMIKNGHLPSLILYGPPGTGKTSLAFAIAGTMKKDFYALNATVAGKKDIESIIEEARLTRNALIFIDEIHRFNRSQQDSLLKAMEEGVFTFIGATTENPYHSVNNAILSRCGQIKRLKPLSPSAITTLLKNALEDKVNGLGKMNIMMNDELLTTIAQVTGDGRTALNLLEDIVWASEKDEKNNIIVTEDTVKQCVQNKGFIHDKKGDIYYDLLSSLQKSIRGSDVDAALYYLARLIEGGDLVSISRRLLVIAYEDIGLANPELCARVLPAIEAVNKLGLPEGRIPLSVITIELCLSAKSNSAYKSLDKAIEDVRNGKTFEIPIHLRDSHYQGAIKLGHGTEYKYPHNYPNSWVYQEYLPKELRETTYYKPKESGEEKRYARIHEKLELLRINNKHSSNN